MKSYSHSVLALRFIASACLTICGSAYCQPASSNLPIAVKQPQSPPVQGTSRTEDASAKVTSAVHTASSDVDTGKLPTAPKGIDWTPLAASLIGASAALVVTYIGIKNSAKLAAKTVSLNAQAAANVRKLELQLKFVENQLEKLYGPLLAECIEADSMFRRVELAMQALEHNEHRHYDLRSITQKDFKDADKEWEEEQRPTHCRFFAKMLVRVFLPSNNRRIQLLQGNLHLLGPAPPTSIYLFLTHAAQLRSIVEVKRHVDLAFSSTPSQDHNRYNDPYILTPFPSMLTGEIVAKVALLKALQREHQYRLASAERTQERVFKRDHYYLLLDESLWLDLAKATDEESEKRPVKHRAHYPPAFPLVWGPYTAIELFELRSWLVSRERSVREMKGLKGECTLFRAMLSSEVATINRIETAYKESQASSTGPLSGLIKGTVVTRPLSHRVAQMFDELDDPGSKMNHPWDQNFEWENLQSGYGDLKLQDFTLCGYKLADKDGRNLPKAEEIAYHADKYRQMRAD